MLCWLFPCVDSSFYRGYSAVAALLVCLSAQPVHKETPGCPYSNGSSYYLHNLPYRYWPSVATVPVGLLISLVALKL